MLRALLYLPTLLVLALAPSWAGERGIHQGAVLVQGEDAAPAVEPLCALESGAVPQGGRQSLARWIVWIPDDGGCPSAVKNWRVL